MTFDIDANGIVHVAAKDNATGKAQTLTISGSSGLSKDEVSRMVREAEQHAAEDQTRRDVVDARNQADALIHAVEQTFTEHRSVVPDSEAARIEAALEAAKRTVKGDDAAAIRGAVTELQQASHAMADIVYQASAQSTAAQGAHVKDAEVVDGEFAETR